MVIIMKKLQLLLLSLILLSPFNVMAYSDYIIPGGENIGIEMDSDGVLVTGFYKVNGKYNSKEVRVGDYITHVNGELVSDTASLIRLINNEVKDNVVILTIRRDDEIREVPFMLFREDDNYKTGLYVKDSLTGIGTLTYIDPATKIYGALGHEVIESASKENFNLKSGSIFRSDVSSIDRSVNGSPGTKNAKFYYSEDYGDVLKNTIHGIYGTYNLDSNKESVEVGLPDELKLGNASIYTVLDDDEVKSYDIKITKIDKDNAIKNIYFEITDSELLEKTGGIVQGMSGSPIMQDGKIFGAITHVVVENVRLGYGIFITTMLEEGEER